MMNVHGYRVEPSEVENALNSIEGVKESIVAGFDVSKTSNIENDMRIYAGVVTDEEINMGFSSITLIRLLSKILEKYGVELDNKLKITTID